MARYFRRRPRRSYRRRAVVPKRFSVETTVITAGMPGLNKTVYTQLIPMATVQGVRKASKFNLDFVVRSDVDVVFAWAVVYVPNFPLVQNQMYQPALNAPDTAGTSLYEPNQHVIMQGIFSTRNANQFKRFSPLARNLQSEDCIVLLVRLLESYTAEVTDADPVRFACTFQYAITF